MSLPYIALFADGSEQWARKVGINYSKFNEAEKNFYKKIRVSNKLYNLKYEEVSRIFKEELIKSDDYFYNLLKHPKITKLLRMYFNFGVDLIDNKFCGNTIMCISYLKGTGINYHNSYQIKKLSEVAGKLSMEFTKVYKPFNCSIEIETEIKEYLYPYKTPFKVADVNSFILFTILCNINFIINFIDKIIIEETPVKFKMGYLLYFYLCDFIDEINVNTKLDLTINKKFKNNNFRNCVAHYGLGQYLKPEEVLENDILKGLTIKSFNLSYFECKSLIFNILEDLSNQIKKIILK